METHLVTSSSSEDFQKQLKNLLEKVQTFSTPQIYFSCTSNLGGTYFNALVVWKK